MIATDYASEAFADTADRDSSAGLEKESKVRMVL
jgi:hypothetical protein